MTPTPRVLQVSVSGSGVPKLPLERARVTRLGLEGDRHRERTVHGGPHRAVCLFAFEAIQRLQAEGHPVEPGSTGENLTTIGIEWSLLPVGTRARVGHQVLLELASPVTPCATQRSNFTDGRFSRISIDLHPSDSRMYARVLAEGEIRPGDVISVEPPPPDSRAGDELLLARLDRAESKSSVQIARAAADAGYDVRIVEDGELAMFAASGLPGPAFNRASGLARLPNLIPDATAFFNGQATEGWLLTDSPPWSGSVAETVFDVVAAVPKDVRGAVPASSIAGLELEVIDALNADRWGAVRRAESGEGEHRDSPIWSALIPRLAERPHVTLVVAVLGGKPVGTAALFTSRGVGWLRAAAVAPAVRGRGIHRALIAERARIAADAGCDLLGAAVQPGTVSARNLESAGFRMVGRREFHRYSARSGE